MPGPVSREQLLRRQSALIAVGGLLLLIVIGLVVGLSGGDDEAEQAARDRALGPPRGTPAPPRAARGRRVRSAMGAAISRPRRWRAGASRTRIELRSPGRTALLLVQSTAADVSGRAVLRAALVGVRRGYRDVRVVSTEDARVAGRPATSLVVDARNRRGTHLRILVSAVQGRRRAWLVEVFAAAGTRALVDAQLALNSLRLSG
jgi:hypothetical protein